MFNNLRKIKLFLVMDIYEELYDSIKKANADASLYYTGFLLNNNIESLQLTWIKLAANLGEYCNLYFHKWKDVIKDMVDFIQSEEVYIKNAFIITAKLCILYQTSFNYISVPKKTLSVLRNNIIDVFEGPYVKIDKYKYIFPKPSNESEFCTKIVSGIIKLWSEKQVFKLRECLEYLCRKDYVIENDFIDFLWKFFELFQPNSITPIYILYKCYFKKKDKSWRYGLLYGIHNMLNEQTASWTVNELYILEQIVLMIPNIWSQFSKTVKKEEQVIDKLHVLTHYIPKKMKEEVEYEYIPQDCTKKISVKK